MSLLSLVPRPRLVKDSRGQASWTHTLAVPAVIVITLWLVLGGIDLTVGGLHVITATKSAAEYAAAVGVWLAFLGQREYTEKVKRNGNPAPQAPNGG